MKPKPNKTKELLKTTDSNEVYKKVKGNINRDCPICEPGYGCNWRKRSQNSYKSWKNYRRTQYRVKEVR